MTATKRKPRGYWTPENVRNEIQKLAEGRDELSATVIHKNYNTLYMKAREYYGNWESALTASGLVAEEYTRQRSKTYWTPERVYHEIQTLSLNGHDLSVTTIEKEYSSLYKKAREYYGNWEAALTSSGLVAEDYIRQRSKGYWTAEQVCKDIRGIAEEGGDLSATAVGKEHSSLYTNAKVIFGDWRVALDESGLNSDDIYRQGIRVDWTYLTIIQEIQRREYEGLGLSAAVVQQDNGGLYAAARTQFGGWREALTESGMNGDDHYRERPKGYWTADTVKKELQERKDKGLTLNVSNVKKEDSSLVSNTYKHIGGWKKALTLLN